MADRLYRCIRGPRLYKTFSSRDGRVSSSAYNSNGLEQATENVLWVASCTWAVAYYTSPMIALYLYRKGAFSLAGAFTAIKLCGYGLTLLISAYILRGYGRYINPEYGRFLAVLQAAMKHNNAENKRALATFDFDMRAWPADFYWTQIDTSKIPPSPEPTQVNTTSSADAIFRTLRRIRTFPYQSFKHFIAHGIGRPMIFPGSIKMLQSAMNEPLVQGRASLIERDGSRAKLVAQDQNEIDTMFLDRRNEEGDNTYPGNKLVICCEGNAGFYEVGIMGTASKAGYSVLGWNLPGFAGSSGLPFPSSIQKAIDVVIGYAVTELDFPVEEIIIFAWSIGGYPATYAGAKYPNLRALILDATFDDLIPLSKSKMPELLTGVVTDVVNDYFPLEIGKQLCQYPGAVLLYRRLKDEIISTEEGDVSTNRGNDLLKQLLRHRYPNLMDQATTEILDEYLSGQDHQTKMGLWNSLGIDTGRCKAILDEHVQQFGKQFPFRVGGDLSPEEKKKLVLFLAVKYMIDFDAAHCTPLPAREFRVPDPY